MGHDRRQQNCDFVETSLFPFQISVVYLPVLVVEVPAAGEIVRVSSRTKGKTSLVTANLTIIT